MQFRLPLRVRAKKGNTNRRGSGNRCRGGRLLTEKIGPWILAILGGDRTKIPRYERVRDGFLGRLRVRFAHDWRLTRGLTGALERGQRTEVFGRSTRTGAGTCSCIRRGWRASDHLTAWEWWHGCKEPFRQKKGHTTSERKSRAHCAYPPSTWMTFWKPLVFKS